MKRKSVVILLVIVFGALLLKTFVLNQPNLKPETVISLYLEKEQSGSRPEAESFLIKDFKNVKIFDQIYEKLKAKNSKAKNTKREFELKESENVKGYAKIILVEKVAGETYFFDFLLSPAYQSDGETEFEVYLEKEGGWFSGYQWKIAKIDSPTLIQYAKMGEEKEIKTGVFAVPWEIIDCRLSDQKCLRVSIRSETESENRLSYSDWKIVDFGQREYSSLSTKIFVLNKADKIEEEISFTLPQNFALKEVLFRNEGKEIHFR